MKCQVAKKYILICSTFFAIRKVQNFMRFHLTQSWIFAYNVCELLRLSQGTFCYIESRIRESLLTRRPLKGIRSLQRKRMSQAWWSRESRSSLTSNQAASMALTSNQNISVSAVLTARCLFIQVSLNRGRLMTIQVV